MTRDEAIEIARRAALRDPECHLYTPKALSGLSKWQPHAWVVDAILLGVQSERTRMAAELRAVADLDGFGCACEPQKQCNTCHARSVLWKVLTPMAKALDT